MTTVTIKDHRLKSRTCEIVVVHPDGGSDAFPYDDTSERNDQLRNARDLAVKIFIAQRCTKLEDITSRGL